MLGAPKFAHIPANELTAFVAWRRANQKACAGATTIVNMKDAVSKRVKELKKIDETVEIDVEFLNNHVEPALQNFVEEDILQAIEAPPGGDPDVKTAMVEIAKLKTSDQVLALGPACGHDINSGSMR